MVIVAFFPCSIVTESSPEIDIFSEGVEMFPEEELGNMPPEEDELKDKSPEEDEELNEVSPEEDELELDEELLELEKPPEEDVELIELPDDELEELLLDEDVTQSEKPKQVCEFAGQQPMTQQSEPHWVYVQLGATGSSQY